MFKIMRIFVALPISEKLQKEVEKFQELYPDLKVRWLDGKNFHITLIPPWEEKNIDKIKSILKLSENKTGPIVTDFIRVFFGPNLYNPRLIWAIGKAPEQIIKLKKDLENMLKMPSERNDFLLHLTLARFKPENFQFFPIKKIDDKINWKEIFNEFVIMQSHLSLNGADYEVLEKYKL